MRGTDNTIQSAKAASARSRQGTRKTIEAQKEVLNFASSRLGPTMSKVDEYVKDSPRNLEQAKIEAWKTLYQNDGFSSADSGSRRPTHRWHQLQIDLCHAQQMANKIIEEQQITDPKHPMLQLRDRINESFVLANDGFIRQRLVNKYGWGHFFEGETDATAKEIVLNEARAGMIYGMSRFDKDHEKNANPLTYTMFWAQAYVRRELTKVGRAINVKSSENDRRQLKTLIRDIENEGRVVSIAELSDKMGKEPEDILSLLPHTENISHLDAPITNANGETTTVGDYIASSNVNFDGEMMDDVMRDNISDAAASIKNPYHRAVIEMVHGLNDRQKANQIDLFDGVFVDEKGNQYASKDSIRKAEHRLGPKGKVVVQHKSQSELSAALKEGKMKFVPGTPEAAELVRIMTAAKGEPWAPTSGSVQDAQLRAEDAIRKNAKLMKYRSSLRYRGDNVLENSGIALEELREVLVNQGICDHNAANKLKSGSLSGDTIAMKGSARLIGEKQGLINPKNGRYTPKMKKLLAEQKAKANQVEQTQDEDNMTEDDFAELMSS